MPKKSVILLILLLLTISPNALKANSSGNVKLEIEDRLEYSCNWNAHGNYWEGYQHFTNFDLYGISDSGSHNFTIAFNAPEELRIVTPSEDTTNRTVDGGSVVTRFFTGTGTSLILGFKTAKPYLDPLNFSLIPSDTDLYSIDEEGRLFFSILVNATEPIDEFEIRSDSIRRINSVNSNLDAKVVWGGVVQVRNTPVGRHRLDLDVQLEAYQNSFSVDLIISKNEATYPIKCLLDGKEVSPDYLGTSITYESKRIEYLVGIVPWVYGYENPRTYLLSFNSTNRSFVLQVDTNSREKIDFLDVSSDLRGIEVKETTPYDNPCYELTFQLATDAESNICLTVYDKVWFLRPTAVSLGNVPESILKEYTNPANSYDGEYIDKDNSLVKAWCEQVAGNETNPLDAAGALFQNLTKTLSNKYDITDTGKPWKSSDILLRASRNESAGVCAHFSRAFAALSMAHNIPTRCVTGTVLGNNATSHEWNEIYLYGYGWVPVDVTWGLFGILPNTRLFCTTINENYSVMALENSNISIRNKTKDFILQIISVCNSQYDNFNNLIHTVPILFSPCQPYFDEYIERIGTSPTMLESGYYHEAVIEISKAYLSLKKGEELLSQILIVTIAVAGVTIFIVYRKRRSIKELLATSLRKTRVLEQEVCAFEDA